MIISVGNNIMCVKWDEDENKVKKKNRLAKMLEIPFRNGAKIFSKIRFKSVLIDWVQFMVVVTMGQSCLDKGFELKILPDRHVLQLRWFKFMWCKRPLEISRNFRNNWAMSETREFSMFFRLLIRTLLRFSVWCELRVIKIPVWFHADGEWESTCRMRIILTQRWQCGSWYLFTYAEWILNLPP